MIARRPIWLASASARRRRLLADASIRFELQPPDVDDGVLRPHGTGAEAWVMAMAYLKGRRVADLLRARDPAARGTVLAADTVCAVDGMVLGQPTDDAHAREMLHRLRRRDHHTITGVALVDLGTLDRILFSDRTVVGIGPLADEEIEAYLRSGQWRGKAGGYNLADRLDAGWPIEFRGDPGTVMGLPMDRLRRLLGDPAETTQP
jgi:septum formation protein